MNSAILIGMSVILLLFIWSWIGLVIVNRMTLEKKIEKLANITNPLPEEERTLRHLKDLRTIEQGKVASAKWIVGLFMLFLVASLAVVTGVESVRTFFAHEILRAYSMLAFVLLTFFCLPVWVGLSLAGSNKPEKDSKGRVEKAAAA